MSVKLGYKFAAIPEWILYSEHLEHVDVRVWGVLARYGDDIRPSLNTIADAIHVSRDTVKRSVARLRDHGALWVERRYDETGEPLPHRYHLAGDTPVEGGRCTDAPTRTDAPGGRGTDAPTVGAPVHPKREQDNESKNNENPPTPQGGTTPAVSETAMIDAQFEAWWAEYPRKIDKKKCRTKWKNMTITQRAEACTGLAKWIAFWESKGEPDKVPHPYTWLGNERWEADPPRPPSRPTPTSKQGRGLDRVRAARERHHQQLELQKTQNQKEIT